MGNNFSIHGPIHWNEVIQEAIQRRKKLRLSQKRFAALCGVSAPTICRFERGQKDIQLSSLLKILNALGIFK